MNNKNIYLPPMMGKVVLPRLVYVIHLAQFLSPNHTSQHYIGSCRLGHFAERMAQHLSGVREMHTTRDGSVRWTGAARYLQVAVERGINFWPVRTFIDETGTMYGGEYYLKSLKNTPKMCPACALKPRTSFISEMREIPVQEALETKTTGRTMRERKRAAPLHTSVMDAAVGLYHLPTISPTSGVRL